MNPLTARGVHRMLTGTLGGRSRVASPVEKRKPTQQKFTIPIWSREAFSSLHLQRFDVGGGILRGHVPVPGLGAELQLGGSDGLFNYVVTQDGGNWLILKLSPSMTVLLDTWDTGWSAGSYTLPVEPLTARNGRIAILGRSPTNIATIVYDTSGAVLYDLSFAVALGDGNCFNADATHLYTSGGAGQIIDIDLAGNTATALTATIAQIQTQVQLSESGFRLSPSGWRVVEVGGDLIFASDNRRGMVRVGIADEAIGTRVRWYLMPHGTGSNPDYGGIALTADETKVWAGANSDAFPDSFAEADLVTVDGVLLRSIHMPAFGGSYGATGLWRGPRFAL